MRGSTGDAMGRRIASQEAGKRRIIPRRQSSRHAAFRTSSAIGVQSFGATRSIALPFEFQVLSPGAAMSIDQL